MNPTHRIRDIEQEISRQDAEWREALDRIESFPDIQFAIPPEFFEEAESLPDAEPARAIPHAFARA